MPAAFTSLKCVSITSKPQENPVTVWETTPCKRPPGHMVTILHTVLVNQESTSVWRGVHSYGAFMYPIYLPEQVKEGKHYSGSWCPWLCKQTTLVEGIDGESRQRVPSGGTKVTFKGIPQ